MRGETMGEWVDGEDGAGALDRDDDANNDRDDDGKETRLRSREGKWESGKGRCAISGRRVLGGTSGLRRVMV